MAFHPSDPSGRPSSGQASRNEGESAAAPGALPGERVARALARAGVASRREVERLIEEGRVSLNGRVLTSPAVNVARTDILTVDGKVIAEREPSRLWRYHKPAGLISSHNDPKGRRTVFDELPKGMPRVISVGRLDLNSEGLLLLTNDGALARELELPSSGLVRRYRARAYGKTSQEKLDRLKAGTVVDGVAYGPVDAKLERGPGSNTWIGVSLAEGKNREVRKVLESIGLQVNRLIRVAYGPFELGGLPVGEVEEVPARQLKTISTGATLVLSTHERPEPTAQRSNGRPGAGELAAARTPRTTARPGAKAVGAKGGAQTKFNPKRKASGGSGRTGAASADEAKPKPVYRAGWARPKPKAKITPKAKTRRT